VRREKGRGNHTHVVGVREGGKSSVFERTHVDMVGPEEIEHSRAGARVRCKVIWKDGEQGLRPKGRIDKLRRGNNNSGTNIGSPR